MASISSNALNVKAAFAWLRSHDARWITVPIAIFIFTRLIVAIGGYVPSAMGIHLIPPTVEVVEDETFGPLKIWARWDAVWYPHIATNGYHYVLGSTLYTESTVAFFPLYPLLIAILNPLIGNALVTGMVISNIACIIALILLYRLTSDLTNVRVAQSTIFYLAAFPSSFFFSVAYSESLFLLLTLAAVLLARSHQWGASALAAGLATATRLPGILLMVIIGLEWAKTQGWTLSTARQSQVWHNLARGIAQNWREIGVIVLGPMGLLAYMLYLQIAFGSPFAWLEATAAWGRTMSDPVTTLITDIGRVLRGETLGGHALVFIDGLNILLVFLILLMLPAIARHVGGSYALYCLLYVLLPLFNRTESMNRYTLMMFPVFIVLARWGQRRKWVDITLKVSFLPLLAIFSALFTNWIFVG